MKPQPHIVFRWPGIARVLATLAVLPAAWAGPYSAPAYDPANTYDAPIPGFIGPDGEGMARLWMLDADYNPFYENPANYVNPLFAGWADAAISYAPAAGVSAEWLNPSLTLGPVTGDDFDVASLGDLTIAQVTGGSQPGRIVVRLANPVGNLPGADFAVFENGFVAENPTEDGGVVGQFSADLAFVEVSSDGSHFARFPARSLTEASVGKYGTITASNVFNLAGKHANSGGRSWGTPFDLSGLAADPLVTTGQVNLNAIQYIRIVDIPGTGQYKDSSGPPGAPIYDPSVTFGSGGFDLEAVGAISVPMTFAGWQQWKGPDTSDPHADPDGDGVNNLVEAALGRDPLHPDREPATAIVQVSGHPAISFTRDTRMIDLTIEVAASSDLVHWTVIARSSAGGALLPVAPFAPFAPVIGDVSASPIQSIGVIRRQTVRDVLVSPSTPRFFRLNIVPPAP